jgi:hypothetical protein
VRQVAHVRLQLALHGAEPVEQELFVAVEGLDNLLVLDRTLLQLVAQLRATATPPASAHPNPAAPPKTVWGVGVLGRGGSHLLLTA